jgi:hypothetical protein
MEVPEPEYSRVNSDSCSSDNFRNGDPPALRFPSVVLPDVASLLSEVVIALKGYSI